MSSPRDSKARRRKRPAPPPRSPAPRGRGPLGAHFVRSNVLSGATVVFARKGVAQASIEDILVASGISRRTFYRLFKNKDDVLSDLFEVASTLFVNAFEDAVRKEAEPAEKLTRAVDTYLEFSRASGPLMRVLFAESLRPDSPLHPRRKKVIEALVALLGREAESFVGHPVEPLLLHGLLAGLEVMASSVLEGGSSEADLGRARASMQRLVAATLAGAGPEVPPLPRAVGRAGGAR